MNLIIPKWIIIMKEILSKEGRSINKIIKNASEGYSHGFNIMNELEKKGWITFNKKGREKLVTLTKQGRKVAEDCLNLLLDI